jgi:hypothetical protein
MLHGSCYHPDPFASVQCISGHHTQAVPHCVFVGSPVVLIQFSPIAVCMTGHEGIKVVVRGLPRKQREPQTCRRLFPRVASLNSYGLPRHPRISAGIGYFRVGGSWSGSLRRRDHHWSIGGSRCRSLGRGNRSLSRLGRSLSLRRFPQAFGDSLAGLRRHWLPSGWGSALACR